MWVGLWVSKSGSVMVHHRSSSIRRYCNRSVCFSQSFNAGGSYHRKRSGSIKLNAGCRSRGEIHVIADNLSAHKTKEVCAFLQANPKVRIHYTPTYSSWLNQVEIWFSKIQRQIIARGVFSSVDDLARKIMRFIRNYNKTATPIRWRYADEKQRISSAV